MTTIKHHQGFTLIELMITVAIVGILAAIAYPSYTAQVQKSRRADAQVALQEIAQRQEAYFLRNYSYAKDVTQLGYAATSADGQYGLSIIGEPNACTGVAGAAACESYVASATPETGKPQTHDTPCQVMTLDNRGRKRGGTNATTAAADNTQACWK
ncbi:type IV pilus assembly protein PilE [Thiothrix caldifontis]|jgi:prepilin-type N-terminal cleavage/methylation domain|uniref:Type IV pilus assembly protein PilE n=1 Tax=Thiothrix caldifontis TaxID=525918 RepID=A0A1H4CSV5_9GAMM|nr:type IV pilin protein [Thiothrix caldifontis]SEA63495.1 type IV pilus assembly protein PilE [Thiothrix caldifontis]